MHSKCGHKRKMGTHVPVSSDNNTKHDYEVNKKTTLKGETFNDSSSDSNVNKKTTLKGETFNDSSSDSNVLIVEPLAIGISTTTEICIAVLKYFKLFGCPQLNNTSSPLKSADVGCRAEFTRCKICGIVSKSQEMLICDYCEEAFHLCCCNEKEPFNEFWNCKECQKSKVRIGQDYQAHVPEWFGPISVDCDDDYFGEPSELQPEEYTDLNTLNFTKEKRGFISNWVQCKSRLDDGTICGKWRRAPLSVTQNNDWECFCAVVWDPNYADCAVPQELETKEVLKSLKYIESLKARMKWNQESHARLSKTSKIKRVKGA